MLEVKVRVGFRSARPLWSAVRLRCGWWPSMADAAVDAEDGGYTDESADELAVLRVDESDASAALPLRNLELLVATLKSKRLRPMERSGRSGRRARGR
ncbi:hypothetical protein BBJ28_00019284 [Nothophytophthora sp. Chile5]|nr:hypothetical protein BBJ28_00019284 [Nothophytophthora sp. Chile5]